MRPDITKYYQYVCICVDDILITSHNPKETMAVIGEHFELKAGSVGTPSMYLGTDTKLRKDSQGYPQYWNLGANSYLLETLQLLLYSASPRIGHLHQALHVFHYLSKHHTSWIPMDPQKVDLEYKGLYSLSPDEKRRKMRSIYQDAVDETPANAPEPCGASVQLNVYVDPDHTGDKVTRRSQTRILIFLNMAPINWYSKKQTTTESSTFGSEMAVLKIATKKVIGLRYKLRIMGVPLEGLANIYCDNDSVVKSSTNPEATLSKKNVSITYHKCRQAFAAGITNIYFQYS